MTLTGLSAKYGSDKHYACETGYTDFYEEMFSRCKNWGIKLLEIGIFEGASLKMWKEYFPLGQIVGVDINKECLGYKEPGIIIRIGSQSDREFLNEVGTQEGNFDIIIDDGSHVPEDQQISFFELFKYLNPGGFYIIEDIHTSYWPDYTPPGMLNTVEFFKTMVDEVKQYEMNAQYSLGSFMWAKHAKSIKYISFHNGLIVVRKK